MSERKTESLPESSTIGELVERIQDIRRAYDEAQDDYHNHTLWEDRQWDRIIKAEADALECAKRLTLLVSDENGTYVERLRFTVSKQAERIRTLEAENAELREALRTIVNRGYTGAEYVARKALEGSKGDE